jgi:hypothetical protein
VPQLAQRAASRAPQPMQKRACAGFSWRHCGHVTDGA